MARFAPDDQVSRIRNSVNIVDVISEYLVLKKAGKNFLGLCPFHAEKTPSFTVNPDRQYYHCYGCSAGGDVFDFVMRQNNLTFPEALAALASRAGIELAPREMTPEQKRRMAQRDAVFAANELARDYFAASLKAPEAAQARQYLEKRQMPPQVMEDFMLGYAPGGWQGLTAFLAKQGVAPAQAERAGLLASKEGGKAYDRFRDRIIFPIMDVNGRVAGFGGRVMDDSLPKYLNSPQTPVYDKKRMLYGLHQARQACRKTGAAFIVEGYFDVLALYAHGIHNAVATCGTALSPDHVRILKGYAHNIFLVFDSDAAGINAARRSLPLFEAEKVKARVLVLPTGHDPDTFVRGKGPQAFLEMADKSLDMVPFLVDAAIARNGLSIEGKAQVVAEVKEQLAAVSDSVTRSLYIKQLAERLAVDEAAVLDAVRDAAKVRPRLAPGQGIAVREAVAAVPDRMEQKVLHMMVHCPESASHVAQRRLFKFFDSPRLKALGMRVLEYLQNGGDPEGGGLMALALEPEDRSLLAQLLAQEETVNLNECLAFINQFEKRVSDRKGADLNRKIQQAQAGGDDLLALRLLAEKNELLKAKALKAQAR